MTPSIQWHSSKGLCSLTFNRWLLWLLCIASTVWAQPTRTDHPNPSLRDLLDPTSTHIAIAAHRGGYETDKADKAPENSVANIKNCASKGYELFETDIQRTKDGHFVMIHDPTIDRETSGTGKASDLALLGLKGLQKRYRDGSLSTERVATLEEFLAAGNGRTVFKADLKPGVSQYFPEIMKRVAAQKAMNGIIFRVPYREANLFARFRAEGLVIPKHSLMFKVSAKKQVDDIKARFDSSTIEIQLKKTDPTSEKALELIRYAAGKGFIVETHAEGDAEDWVKLMDAGVRMFHTHAPSKVKTLLESKDR